MTRSTPAKSKVDNVRRYQWDIILWRWQIKCTITLSLNVFLQYDPAGHDKMCHILVLLWQSHGWMNLEILVTIRSHHILILAIICTKYRKTPFRNVGAVEWTRQDVPYLSCSFIAHWSQDTSQGKSHNTQHTLPCKWSFVPNMETPKNCKATITFICSIKSSTGRRVISGGLNCSNSLLNTADEYSLKWGQHS